MVFHSFSLSVTGKTLAENAKIFPPLSEGQVKPNFKILRFMALIPFVIMFTFAFDAQQIIRPLDNPIKSTGHIQILYGNLAPEGSVAKITGKEGLFFSGDFCFHHQSLEASILCVEFNYYFTWSKWQALP